MRIPRNWRSQIQRLLQAPQRDEASEQWAILERMLEKLRHRHLCEAIDNETFRREVRSIKSQLGSLAPRPPSPIEAFREPVELFRSVGRIVVHPARGRDVPLSAVL